MLGPADLRTEPGARTWLSPVKVPVNSASEELPVVETSLKSSKWNDGFTCGRFLHSVFLLQKETAGAFRVKVPRRHRYAPVHFEVVRVSWLCLFFLTFNNKRKRVLEHRSSRASIPALAPP